MWAAALSVAVGPGAVPSHDGAPKPGGVGPFFLTPLSRSADKRCEGVWAAGIREKVGAGKSGGGPPCGDATGVGTASTNGVTGQSLPTSQLPSADERCGGVWAAGAGESVRARRSGGRSFGVATMVSTAGQSLLTLLPPSADRRCGGVWAAGTGKPVLVPRSGGWPLGGLTVPGTASIPGAAELSFLTSLLTSTDPFRVAVKLLTPFLFINIVASQL